MKREAIDRLLPWLVLTVFVVLSGVVSVYVWRTTRNADRARFDNGVQAARDAMASRLETYVNLLRSAAAMASSGPVVRRDELAAFVRKLDVQGRYPGIQGIGFSLRVPAEARDELAAEMRASGVPDFRVWPDTPRAEYHAIVMLEPLDRRNQAAIGYDMFTNPVRREAMVRARDTGLPAASGRVTLVQEIDLRKQSGFLIYVPVYTTGSVPETVAERRATLLGFVYAPFRMDDLFGGIFGTQRHPEVGFEIHDGGRLLYATDNLIEEPRFTRREAVVVAGHEWIVLYESRRSGAGTALLFSVATFVAGVIIALLIASMIRLQLNARSEAEATAEKLRASQSELEQANRAKDEFLATLSHELRTPLTSIVGWAQMLRDDGDEELRRTGIESIYRSSLVQAQLVDDLLDVSRITAGTLRIETERVEVSPVIEAAIETVRPAANAKGVVLHTDLEREVFVIGDAQRLQQVVWNLLSNAVKFTPSGGRVSVLLTSTPARAVIEVRDTGQGIPREFMPHLFERFRQADSSPSRSQMGLGLGLAIVRHLVELHGGDIAAESSGVGRGATFRVSLPLGR